MTTNPFIETTQAQNSQLHSNGKWKKALAWVSIVCGPLTLAFSLIDGRTSMVLIGLAAGTAISLPGAWFLIHELRVKANPSNPPKSRWGIVAICSIVLLVSSGFIATSVETPTTETPASDAQTSASPQPLEIPTTAGSVGTKPKLITVEGHVGEVHGAFCDSPEDYDCAINFIIRDLERVTECKSYDRLVSANLVKISGIVSVPEGGHPNGVDSTYWPGFVSWSTVGDDGVDRPTDIFGEFLPENGIRGAWPQSLFPGDSKEFTQYMEVPETAKTLRLTDTVTQSGRWEFALDGDH
ncbi:hypothetical protein [Corynebacterium flavescens]|uniref:hypothetical protein n=1 Tax=Corynebacterium flavescens TaxID=28028 RepID=UPI002649683A|nr:hypothetical protein [Corynebacterium flavescens]MDN6430298.1 hypothetical protein [Corynebacterium flavescens]MDN6474286.1 hypothetical protein [Corynebacterium flavescens]MDN6531339.1 hypothetical protein [Corynebacterium flavescens]MDN6600371.1 hypothetical protein [Corynebacterium flavescens]MDN6647313.1 hypothetical protein [Corynebacterium flavescens]